MCPVCGFGYAETDASPFIICLSAAVGLSFLQFTNMNSMRNLFIVGVSIFLGLSVPEYFFRYTMAAQRGPAHTKAGWVRRLSFTLPLVVLVARSQTVPKIGIALRIQVWTLKIVTNLFFLLCPGQFNDYINTIFSSPPTVGLIVAVFLDNTLETKGAANDRGLPWWARFRSFKGDSRNEEFYSLPFNLNRFFPPA